MVKKAFSKWPALPTALGEASNALTLLLFIVLARFLNVDFYGELVAIFSAAGILSEIQEFGIPTLITRNVARQPQTAWEELMYASKRQAALSAPMLALLYLFMRIADISPAHHVAGLLIGVSFCLRSIKAGARGVCRGLGRFGTETVFLWTERLSLLIFGIAVLAAGGGLFHLGVVFIVVRALDLAAYLIYMRRITEKGGLAKSALPARTFPSLVPLAVTTLIWSLYYHVNATMLSILATAHDTGIYGAMYRFVDILQVLPRVIVRVAYPALALDWIQNRERFEKTYTKTSRTLAVFTLPLFVLLMGCSEFLLNLTFGPAYTERALALQLIFIAVYFSFQSHLRVQLLLAADKEALLAAEMVVTLIINIALNLVLLPSYGFVGAAVATLGTEVAHFVLLVILVRWKHVMTGVIWARQT